MKLDNYLFPKIIREFPFLEHIPIKQGDNLKIQKSEIHLSKLIDQRESFYYVGDENNPDYIIKENKENSWILYKKCKTLQELAKENVEMKKKLDENFREMLELANPSSENKK